MTKIAKRSVYLAATVAVGATLHAAPVPAEEVRWQVPVSFASTLTALGDTIPWVAERLRLQSGGEIDLIVAEPGTILPALAIFDSVSQGSIDAGYAWMGYEWGTVPSAALFGATPFGLESPQFLAWMEFHGGKELLAETYHPYNVHPILCGTISPETAGWFRKEVKTTEDMKGLKFRAAGLGGEIMAEFGMAVTVMPGGELFQALETNVLDGTEFSLPTVDEQSGFYQVAPYLYMPGWHQPSTNQFLYVNLDVWNGLEDATRAEIETACMAGNAYAMARAEALQGAALARFAEKGTNIRVYDEAMLKAFYEATQRVIARHAEKDPMFAKVHESMMKFQDENAPWLAQGYLPRDWKAHIAE